MRVIGIAVKMAGKPKVACVVLDEASGETELIEGFDLTTSAFGVVDQAHDLARHLSGRLPGLSADVAVVRRADFAQVRSAQQARSDRLIVEGALVHAAKSQHLRTLLRTGRETGLACGSDKDAATAEGAQLDRARPEAAAAALSGLRKPEL